MQHAETSRHYERRANLTLHVGVEQGFNEDLCLHRVSRKGQREFNGKDLNVLPHAWNMVIFKRIPKLIGNLSHYVSPRDADSTFSEFFGINSGLKQLQKDNQSLPDPHLFPVLLAVWHVSVCALLKGLVLFEELENTSFKNSKNLMNLQITLDFCSCLAVDESQDVLDDAFDNH
jgi:hypothetical protein